MNLKEIIEKMGLKQVEVAHRIGMRPCNLNIVLSGYVTCPKKYRQRLADLLNIGIEELSQGESVSDAKRERT